MTYLMKAVKRKAIWGGGKRAFGAARNPIGGGCANGLAETAETAYFAGIMTGRPSTYTPEIGQAFCDALPSWDKSLEALCKTLQADDPAMPGSASTVYGWLYRHEEFAQMYARAKSAQLERLADEIVEISDNADQDTVTKRRKDGTEYEAMNSEYVQRAKLRVDTRKWLLAKLKPRVYGDKLDITSNNEHVGGKDLTDTQREARAASILAGAKRRAAPDVDPFS